MSNTAMLERIETLAQTVQRLEARVEELEEHEDLRDLDKAIAENGNRPLVPWEQAKLLLDLD
jgi:hypothetical protein